MSPSASAPAPALLHALAVGAWLVSAAEGAANFTVYSAPVRLRPGQVFNKDQDPMPLPPDVVARYADGQRLLAISGFDVDMVRRGDGTETQVKLSDHYLHHYGLNFGTADAMQQMLAEAASDKRFERMLKGCHAMTRAGVSSFLDRLQRRRKAAPGAGRERLAMFGSASGAEYRHNPQRFEAPFRILLERPEVWAPLVHIINVQADRPSKHKTWSPLIECPCTPQRKINVANGTIDGRLPDPQIQCSESFAATGNPSCHLSTYVGGWRCCEHGVFVVDTDEACADPGCTEKPEDEVFLKFTFFYDDAASSDRTIEAAACCDVTGVTQGFENIEYDIPQCAAGTPPESCVHVAETVQPLGYFGMHPKSPESLHQGTDLVDLVFAAPHLHLAGISITLQDAITNETLCEVRRAPDDSQGVAYGHGSGPGDERDYLVGLSTCRWGGKTARRYRRDHPMRTRAVYDASQPHTGVMSLWLLSVSAVDEPDFFV